jgi:hypothetical protein
LVDLRACMHQASLGFIPIVEKVCQAAVHQNLGILDTRQPSLSAVVSLRRTSRLCHDYDDVQAMMDLSGDAPSALNLVQRRSSNRSIAMHPSMCCGADTPLASLHQRGIKRRLLVTACACVQASLRRRRFCVGHESCQIKRSVPSFWMIQHVRSDRSVG